MNVQWFAATLVVAGLVAPSHKMAYADSCPRCKAVRGTFMVTTFSGSDCAAPAGLCGAVRWTGDINGQSSFQATSVVPSVDTPVTNVILTTGDNVIQLEGGTLATKDAVVFRTAGTGDFAEVDTIVGGTGRYAKATGAWHAAGVFDGNQGTGRYEGQICMGSM